MSDFDDPCMLVTCAGCGWEYPYLSSPMIRDELWKSISNEHFDEHGKWHSELLCLSCMEKRLGRRITPDDFGPWYGTSYHNKVFMKHYYRRKYAKTTKSAEEQEADQEGRS